MRQQMAATHSSLSDEVRRLRSEHATMRDELARLQCAYEASQEHVTSGREVLSTTREELGTTLSVVDELQCAVKEALLESGWLQQKNHESSATVAALQEKVASLTQQRNDVTEQKAELAAKVSAFEEHLDTMVQCSASVPTTANESPMVLSKIIELQTRVRARPPNCRLGVRAGRGLAPQSQPGLGLR